MLNFVSENFDMIVRGVAALLIGVVSGGVHAIWSLRTNVPIVTTLTLNIKKRLGRHRSAPPPKKNDLTWFLASLFGSGASGVVVASLLDGKRGIALYFIGLFLSLFPSIAVIVVALIVVVVAVVWNTFN